MPFFQTEPDEPLMMFEVFLPKRMEYQSKLYEALQFGLVIDKVREFLLATGHSDSLAEMQRIQSLIPMVTDRYTVARVQQLQQVCFGFSLYEVDGVFLAGPSDGTQERTQVVRLLFKADPVYSSIKVDPALTPEQANLLMAETRAFQRKYDSWAESGQVARYLSQRNSSSNSERLEHYLNAIEEWRADVLLFVFGYLVGKITEDLAINESEIWVTSHQDMSVNVIRRVIPITS